YMDFGGPHLTNYHGEDNGRSEVYWTELPEWAHGAKEDPQWEKIGSEYWMVSSDVLLDTVHVTWHISSDTNVPSDAYDLQSVLLHELGHSQGLKHCSENYPNNVLQPVPKGTVKRTLQWGDKSGATFQHTKPASGNLPFNTAWRSKHSLPVNLTANITVPSGKELVIENGVTVNLNGKYIKSTGGTITDQGATWNPNIYVKYGNTLKGHYSTIQQAIDNAVSGQTVYVGADTYTEQITMKSGVDVIGAGSGSTTIDGGGGGVAVTFNNVSSRLSGFTVKGFIGVRVQNNSSPTIDHNKATDSYTGMYLTNSNPTLSYNTIQGNHGGLLAQTSSDPNLEDGHNTFQ
ncbi:MAG TPA: matrixin family metalloprotease, partial [Anaerolineae bacterium]|nr:matrixin family metalloprotease [Anaerolineae bacterium]